MVNIQVRGVPEDVHPRLKVQAAVDGQSLNEYLLARMRDLARAPTVPELAERIPERAGYEGAVDRRGHPRRAAPPVIVVDASALTDFLVGRRAAHDAFAEALADPVLITADAGLAARAERPVGVIHCA